SRRLKASSALDDLHVLLRHRLLLQPCRCQTLSAVPVELDAGDLAVSHGPDGRAQERHLDIAALGAGVVARQNQHATVARVDHVLDPGVIAIPTVPASPASRLAGPRRRDTWSDPRRP